MPSISEYLNKHGPSRATKVTQWLVEHGVAPDAARKRVSRVKPPIQRLSAAILSKGEHFLYLQHQHREQWFWTHIQRDMREVRSIFGVALDALIARGGAVLTEDFPVISAGTLKPRRGHVLHSKVHEQLQLAGLVSHTTLNGQNYICIVPDAIESTDVVEVQARRITENIVLDGIREWARKLGLASYNAIRIRGDETLVHSFAFDLTGPSYLLPVRGASAGPGFLVADVFSGAELDVLQIQYFIRKVTTIHEMIGGGDVLPLLVADRFTSEALTAGHKIGLVMATPTDLFGKSVGAALALLLDTIKRAAQSIIIPNDAIKLLNTLSEIEGRSGNLRGILFELLSAYLAGRDGSHIEVGQPTRHKDGRVGEIDVLKWIPRRVCIAIECKGKSPGGIVTLEEVETWFRRIEVHRDHLRRSGNHKESEMSFELWTSGGLSDDAITLLESEKVKRTKYKIAWKDGRQVLELALELKEKAIADAIKQHFIQHA